jgi:LysM repeat protein
LSAAATAGTAYTVKSGDTLTRIAKRNHVSVKALRTANSLTTDHLKVGQKLTIPAKAEAAAPATTTPPATDTTTPGTAAAPTTAPTTAAPPAGR